MFSTPEYLARATRDLFDAQAAFFTQLGHVWTEAGVDATEQQVDATKTILATATVATRQWLSAGNAGAWMIPGPHGAQQAAPKNAPPTPGAPCSPQ